MLLSAAAPAGPVERRGDCVGGPGRWRLVVEREGPKTLRVRYELRDVVSEQTWQLFLSDNGIGVYSSTEVSENNRIRVREEIRDRWGRDRISATAVNMDSGVTCGGSLRF